MLIESLGAVLAGAASVASVVLGVHYRYKQGQEGRWRVMEDSMSTSAREISSIRQDVLRQGDQVVVIERDTRKLESSIEKDISEVKQILTGLQKLIIESLLKRDNT